MGNAESSSSSSSSQFSNKNDDNHLSSRRNQSSNYGNEEEENSYSTIIKMGATAITGAAVVFGVWNLAKSSDDSGDKRKETTPGLGSSSRSSGFDHIISGSRRLSGEPKTNCYQLEGSRGSGLTGRNNQHPGLLPTIKIMTYNVWFKEDAKVDERMKAIGGLILKHNPDIIFFQEVTPTIYDIFQNFSWWEAYECSVSPVDATRECFCMMLSKFPVDEWNDYILGNSRKELCTAKIDVGNGQKLIVATSHLKSPNPPTLYRKERASQAKGALDLLNSSTDVIFGGDTNWDETIDGKFPLLENWVDAWTLLRPGEKGLTYNTKSNAMLTCKKPLQKRLDRFICKLKNFELQEIEMIGMEAMPGISYYNKGKMLPVLPSDHYGLLLTIY